MIPATKVHVRAKPFGFNHGSPTPGTPPETRVLCGVTEFDVGAAALSFPGAVLKVAKVPAWECCIDCVGQLGVDPTLGNAFEGVLRTIAPKNSDSGEESVVTASAGDVYVLVDNEEMDKVYAAGESVSIKVVVQGLPKDGLVRRKCPAFTAQGTIYGDAEIVGKGESSSLRVGQVVNVQVRISP